MNQLPLADIIAAFRRAGVTRLLVKRLAANDNSKNQVYLGGNFELLNLLPLSGFRAKPSEANRAIIHADMSLSWMRDDGTLSPAPHSKVILYPQYPEVRWSGFLLGTRDGPSTLMNEAARIEGRILFFGVRADRTVVARVTTPDSPSAVELAGSGFFDDKTALVEYPLEDPGDQRDRLLSHLKQIAARGWVDPVRFDSEGRTVPCLGTNCGGVTLETLLGIRANSRSEPDFEGWEVKQFGVRDFQKYRALSPVTLMTPEPTEGYYVTAGIEAFIRKYGYPDTKGREGRLNVGGRFLVGTRLQRTGLTLRLVGFSESGDKVEDADGGIELVDDRADIAARWPFAALLEHWNRKHAKAAYVPSMRQKEPRKYRYADEAFLGIGTDFGLFLKGLSSRLIAYDPGIKLEGTEGPDPKSKRRSQFRIAFTALPAVYRRFEVAGFV
jgi:hypothetical protein